MTGQVRRPQTLRWLIKRTRVSGGRRSGMSAWVVLRYRPAIASRARVVEAVLGHFESLPAATERARLDCAVFYDERSRP